MDIEILLWLQEHRSPFWDRVLSAVTELGGELPLLALLCGVYWCVCKRAGTFLLFSFFGNILVNQFLKLTFCARRPWVRDARITPLPGALSGAGGYSFPSGHTANAFAGYGGIARLLRGKHFGWLMWVLAALIGFSRCYVGVHTPQDVLASVLVSILIVLGAEKLLLYLDKHPGLDVYAAAAGIALSVGLALYAGLKPYSSGSAVTNALDALKFAGGAVGVLIGWVLERRFLRFHTDAGALKKCLRLLGGLIVVVAIMKLGKAPLNAWMGEIAGNFVRYGLIGIFATYLWPLAFTKLGI